MKQRGDREQGIGTESEAGGGDWRPFLFLGGIEFWGGDQRIVERGPANIAEASRGKLSGEGEA